MKIASVSAKFPSRRVTNDDILSVIDEHNKDISPRIVEKYKRIVRIMLRKVLQLLNRKTRYSIRQIWNYLLSFWVSP